MRGVPKIKFWLAVCIAILKPKTHIVVLNKHSKQTETVIHFKNGSSINILNGQSKRGNRALLYPLYNPDGTADHVIDKETLEEVLKHYARE